MSEDKALPLDKTAVFEFKLGVVDRIRRTRYMAEAVAAKLPRTTPFQSGDQSITDVVRLTINGVTTIVVIYCFEPLLIAITKGTGGDAQTITDIQCSGLFVMTGAINQIVVKTPGVGKESRVTFSYA